MQSQMCFPHGMHMFSQGFCAPAFLPFPKCVSGHTCCVGHQPHGLQGAQSIAPTAPNAAKLTDNNKFCSSASSPESTGNGCALPGNCKAQNQAQV